jgi:hypothetical protein
MLRMLRFKTRQTRQTGICVRRLGFSPEAIKTFQNNFGTLIKKVIRPLCLSYKAKLWTNCLGHKTLAGFSPPFNLGIMAFVSSHAQSAFETTPGTGFTGHAVY